MLRDIRRLKSLRSSHVPLREFENDEGVRCVTPRHGIVWELTPRIDYAVSLDQYDTLYASQSRFMGFEDVVDRLLPWHIWQVPEEELNLPSEEKDAVGVYRAS